MGYTVIIPAAGQGKRMKRDHNKLFIEIDGETIIRRTVSVFQQHIECDQIIIAAHKNEVAFMKEHLQSFSKVTHIIPGGSERQYSIKKALNHVEKSDVVMVHDGARPFVSEKSIQQLYKDTLENGSSILAVQAKDTIKQVLNGKVEKTFDRKTMWQVQTPQSFKKGIILDSYQKAEIEGFLGTDDASLVERAGYEVSVSPGNYDNIKITTLEDLFIAESILERRGY